MAEWFKAMVLKTIVCIKYIPWVRIPFYPILDWGSSLIGKILISKIKYKGSSPFFPELLWERSLIGKIAVLHIAVTGSTPVVSII